MITVRDKLMDLAATQAERDLLSLWLSEEHDDLCARQRAWQEVRDRRNPGTLTFNW
jgi:hypothetical protein|tara:strand:- start:1029 stop:1196 length:168 start_codon:yes stop_codon:yes gene_type:complete